MNTKEFNPDLISSINEVNNNNNNNGVLTLQGNFIIVGLFIIVEK